MSYKEKDSSLKHSSERRREDDFSGMTEPQKLSSVDRELNRLFADFWESPKRARQSKLRQVASTQYGDNTIDDDPLDGSEE